MSENAATPPLFPADQQGERLAEQQAEWRARRDRRRQQRAELAEARRYGLVARRSRRLELIRRREGG